MNTGRMTCPNCDKHADFLIQSKVGNKTVCEYCKSIEEIKFQSLSLLNMDRRKLKRIDISTLTDIFETIVGKNAKGYNRILLEILRGLSIGDEFEFQSHAPSIRKHVTNFVNKYIPEPNIASEALKRDATQIGHILFAMNKGRERTER